MLQALGHCAIEGMSCSNRDKPLPNSFANQVHKDIQL